ncbi:hypothetical protein M405DRAFT_804266 [Rhizopogon salebrosus TDB-379]|nr:hypothetical protein M405DRAFT_804266 [Rhizopogon salebrosus TDB-379]
MACGFSRNTAPRPSKHHIDAGETEATPRFPPHSLQRHRDARDGDNNIPALLSHLASLPTNELPASASFHSLLPFLHTSTPRGRKYFNEGRSNSPELACRSYR